MLLNSWMEYFFFTVGKFYSRLLHEQRKPELKTVEEEDEVYDGEETIDYWFFVNDWFASDEGDKQIIRELTPTDKDGRPLKRALDGTSFKILPLIYKHVWYFL